MNLIIDLSKVSLYRTQLMGIAAILIVLCHASLYGVQMCSVLSTIFKYWKYRRRCFFVFVWNGLLLFFKQA